MKTIIALALALTATAAAAYEFDCPSEQGKALDACRACSAQATGELKQRWVQYGECLVEAQRMYGGKRVLQKDAGLLGMDISRINLSCEGKYQGHETVACLSCNAELADEPENSYLAQVSQCQTRRELQYSKQIDALNAEIRAISAEKAAEQDRMRAEAARQLEVERQQAVAAELAKRKEQDEQWAREHAQQEAKRKMLMQQAERESAAAERAARNAVTARNQQEDARRASCGSDYKSIRVGMTVGRAQQCVAPFKLVGQLNRVDGVLVDSYQHCRGYRCTHLTVIDGTVVAWSR